MNGLQPSDFPLFFKAVYGYEPFPWQRMLVERVAARGWPEGIDLPTASGKTACLDAAVFLLALGEQDGRLPLNHPARRRIFFVVDRRIVVDEAHERAQRLALKLEEENDGIVGRVAERLRALAGDESSWPLIACRLRGGTVLDERWRRSPAQPAVITSTVDQLGSRLLFRSYGSSNLSAPIEAALTACDSLVLLDEAHCAVPFMQTARAVKKYSGGKWVDDGPVVAPLTFSILSATLPRDVADVFPASKEQRTEALSDDQGLLARRANAPKRAELIEVKDAKDNIEKLIAEAEKRAKQAVKNGRQRIAIMVNRVARASRLETELRKLTGGKSPKLDAEVALMTGRMRPVDRDRLVKKWASYLKAGSQEQLDKPMVLITTQCLEVGADFSFDTLITECASLDALRQRFGRLNRLGEFEAVEAAVLVRSADLGAKATDPIYGTALKETWNWLNEQADDERRFDFGIEAVENLLPKEADELEELFKKLNVPSPDAPVLLPAHVDLLCQTAPQPTPDPDVAIFLHGPQRNVPEARVVFRADFSETSEEGWKIKWTHAASLLPPLTAEALTLPLWLIRKWLSPDDKPEMGTLSDVENQESHENAADVTRGRPFVIWRGSRDSIVSYDPRDIRPNETIVVPAENALAQELGHAFCRAPNVPLDAAELAYPEGREQHVLRLVPTVFTQPDALASPDEVEPLKALFAWAGMENRDRSTLIEERLPELRDYQLDPEAPPEWREGLKTLQKIARELARAKPLRIETHPTAGAVLIGPRSKEVAALDFDFGDEDDSMSFIDGRVDLAHHTRDVQQVAGAWAERCLSADLVETLTLAAERHDTGKADPRFQEMLHGDEIAAAVALTNGILLAKSGGSRRAPRNRQVAADLPNNFRHEMLSMQVAEASNALEDNALRQRVLHLIASHHGHGRPFAPVCLDADPPDVEVQGVILTAAQRREREREKPAHRLDSGVAERFWELTRRYGWWGLAYIEATLRLADRAASAAETGSSSSFKKQETPR